MSLQNALHKITFGYERKGGEEESGKLEPTKR